MSRTNIVVRLTSRPVHFTPGTSCLFFTGPWSPSTSDGLMLVRDSMSRCTRHMRLIVTCYNPIATLVVWACLRGQYHPRCLPPRFWWQLQCMTLSCHTWQPLGLRFEIFKKFFLAEEMDPSFNLNTNIKVPTPHIFEPNFFALIKSRPSALYYNSFQLVDLQVSQFDIFRIFCHHFLTLVIILLCL